MAVDFASPNAVRSSPRQSQWLTINPSDPRLGPTTASLATGSHARRTRTKNLALVSGEEGSPFMHPSLPSFLASLTSISTLHISWYSLDWNSLPSDQRHALIHLISLDSLVELEIVASRNFPLDLLQRFSGTRLYLTFIGTLFQHTLTQVPTQAPVNLQALAKLSLVGQRNIVAFADYFQSRPGLRGALRSIESLSLTCIDDDQVESRRNLGLIGHFLKFLDESRIKVLRVQDERPDVMIGQPLGLQTLASLRDVSSVEAHLCIKRAESPREVCATLNDWLTSLLSKIPPSNNLISLDVTYKVLFSRPPHCLDTLFECMGQLWKELDLYLVRKLSSLRQVNVGFQFHGVDGHERWMGFNADNQPVRLNERGSDCSFWVRVI